MLPDWVVIAMVAERTDTLFVSAAKGWKNSHFLNSLRGFNLNSFSGRREELLSVKKVQLNFT